MENDAHADLGDIAAARAALADRLLTPPWFLPAMGAALAVAVLGVGIGIPAGMPFGIVGTLASIALPFVLVSRAGVSHSGSVRGAHNRWLWALLAVVVVVVSFGAAVLIALSTAESWLALVPAVLVTVAAIVLGRSYEQAPGRTVRAGA